MMYMNVIDKRTNEIKILRVTENLWKELKDISDREIETKRLHKSQRKHAREFRLSKMWFQHRKRW